MEKNRFWELLAKVQSGDATPEEQLELNQHLVSSPEDQQLVQLVNEFWTIEMPGKDQPDASEAAARWEKFSTQIGNDLPVANQTGKVRRMALRLAGVAAIGLLLIGSIWQWNAMRSSLPAPKNVVSTKNGSRSKVEMPDGTQVWLNVGSRIEYDGDYGKDNREITLTGEAYFDVVHNEKKPFIIHTRAMNVKVLGTVFNVKAYPGDGVTEAALIRGSIEVTFPGRPDEKLILRPNDKIAVTDKGDKVEEQPSAVRDQQEKPQIMVAKLNYQPADSTIIETSWVKNKLIFRSKPFAELAKDMERWFNVNIQIQDSYLPDKKFTGTFSNESITEALDALSLTFSFQYQFDKSSNTVIIK
jgi:transmembrane sensor